MCIKIHKITLWQNIFKNEKNIGSVKDYSHTCIWFLRSRQDYDEQTGTLQKEIHHSIKQKRSPSAAKWTVHCDFEYMTQLL